MTMISETSFPENLENPEASSSMVLPLVRLSWATPRRDNGSHPTCKEGLEGVQQGCTGVTQTLGLSLLELRGQQQGLGGARGTENAPTQPAVVPRAPKCPACPGAVTANSPRPLLGTQAANMRLDGMTASRKRSSQHWA